MEDALKETCFVDIMHPDLQKVAKELRADSCDPVGIAARTLSYVVNGYFTRAIDSVSSEISLQVACNFLQVTSRLKSAIIES